LFLTVLFAFFDGTEIETDEQLGAEVVIVIAISVHGNGFRQQDKNRTLDVGV